MNRFVTEVRTKFNPFSPSARPARLFLAYLPPDARASGMSITTTLLPKASTEPPLLQVKFSRFLVAPVRTHQGLYLCRVASFPNCDHLRTEDGKELNLESEKLGIKGILEEIDRHCRVLQKQADLSE